MDLTPFRTAQSLAQLASTPQEQDLARDVLRKADHEVDFAFAGALYNASSQPIPSTPEIKAILERISTSEKEDADLDADVARLTKLVAGAKDNQKEALTQQLDLTKSRQELIEDELADAHQDLERAGGDPQSRVQRMVDEYNASEQSSGGQLDLSIVGRQGNSAIPVSNSFISRVRAMYELHSIVGRLAQEERAAICGGRNLFRQARPARETTGRGPIATEEKIGRCGFGSRDGWKFGERSARAFRPDQRRHFFL